MKSFDGYLKKKLGDSYVLLAGGGEKLLSDFSMSNHGHNYAGSPSDGGPAYKLNSLDLRNKYPADIIPNYHEAAMTFMLMSTLGISNHGTYADVLSMSSYNDSSGGSENAIIFAKNNYSVWHTQFGVKSTNSWGTPYLFADSANSSVSGGGSSLGSSITVKICETEKTLTIPNSIAWSLLTGIPSSFTPSSHNHAYIVSGGSISNHINGTLQYVYHVSRGTSGVCATTDNSNAIITVNRHEGDYDSQFGLGSDHRLYYRSYSALAISSNVTKAWNKIAWVSDIPTTMAWTSITGKPSTFPPSDHDHQRILPTRHDSDAPNPNTKGQSLTFQFSYFDNDWWNVLNMRSYSDLNYMSALLLSPAGNPGSDVGYGNLYWRLGRRSTWIAKRLILDSSNYNSYSPTLTGGGASGTWGINISGSAKYLTGEGGVSTLMGYNTLYYSGCIPASTSGTPSTYDNSNSVLTVNRHSGNYYSLIGFGSDGRIKYRSFSAVSIADAVTRTWNTLAYTSELTWSNISSKPETATRWPSWSEVTSKPSTFPPSSHTHDHIEGPDWRSTSHTPQEYMSMYHKGSLTCEFSSSSVLGIAAASNGYSALVTITPWEDASGGLPAQIACGNGGWYFRCASSTTAWGGFNVYWNSSGNVYAANFYTTSDRSKKQNISSFSEHIRKFQLKDTEKWHYGVIAQEVPKLFVDGEEGNMTVNYNSMLSYYIGLLENRVALLESELKALKEKLGSS